MICRRWIMAVIASAVLCAALPVTADDATETEIRLPRTPAISPDGDQIAFAWQNDIWTADIEGGIATRVSIHAATEGSPHFSPDGKQLYFTSNRSGRTQIYVMPVEGGAAKQITFDSNRKAMHGITADGRYLLISQSTDRGWHYSESSRVFLLDTRGEEPKKMLFDVGVRDAALSPDGTKVLFVRGRSNWNRKGYKGSQAAQLWLADLSTEPATLTRLSKDRENFQNVAEMDPLWSADGKSYYFNSDPDGVFNLYQRELGSEDARQVTDVAADGVDDGVAFPALSRDGRTLLMRRGFELLKCDPKNGELEEIELFASGDSVTSPIERKQETRATTVAFTPDGKQVAFVSGNDIYVMDRILKEPVQVTDTAHPETSLLFSSDGSRLFYVTDSGGEVDIWEATHTQEDGIWWLADEFKLRQVTDDRDVESSLELSPNGSHVAYNKGPNLFVMDDDGTDHRQVAQMWSPPSFDWAPDGKWLTYATQDDDYNSDIFIVPIDGTREPFNLSRHPDLDSSPTWSGDGKRIAWIGRRDGEEIDIYVVELAKSTDEETERDEKLKKALEAMKKGKGKKAAKGEGDKKGGAPSKNDADSKAGKETPGDKEGESNGNDNEEKKKDEDKPDDVQIDFDGIFDRIDRLRYTNSSESSLIWIEDGSKLAFSATIDGKRGFYSVKFPRPEAPKKISDSPLSEDRWIKESKEFVGHKSGVPATMNITGKTETFDFQVRSERDWREIRQIVFDQGWRAMRDRFYDEAYNNKDWYAMRAKYRPMAAECLGAAEFSELMNMMLGELNASHMGHRGGSDPLPDFDPQNEWSPITYHLGLRFQHGGKGPGLVVESVIPGSPCDRARSLVKAGETLLKIDGNPVSPDVDIEKLLTMEKLKDVTLRVRSATGEERDVVVRPTASVANLLYEEWVEKTRAKVDELSEGKLGYLHIQGMNFRSFRQMEEDLYHAGAGKEGLIIDVRFNGGGSTADHVMTALTQPRHAITQSRGSGEGYPQDRRVYASWTKPIVLLCNEHSFSNAEILSHAVKQTNRGRLVGMRTAGGVISTGSVRLLDGGTVRMPMRGWYLASTGEDMELNGCEPHIAFWNDPRWNSPGGEDAQLAKAVETLEEDVAAEKAKGKVKIVPASKLRK
jgi:tricorn protease